MPLINRLMIGSSYNAASQPNCTIEFLGIRRGSFDDVAMTMLLHAA